VGKMDEMIIVVSREKLFNNERFTFDGMIVKEGIKHIDGAEIMHNIQKEYEVMRRGNAEEDPTYKQIISYTVIRRGNQIFLYRRLKGGGETRLHEKLSIGVGGHMNDFSDDEKALIGKYSFFTLLTENTTRELYEELFIESESLEFDIFGLINDDSDDVGKVHIGIVNICDIDEDAEVEINETEQLAGDWVSLEYLLKEDVFARLENWSQITVKALTGDQA
jgi:predicted NUDIX family phosphoesterase